MAETLLKVRLTPRGSKSEVLGWEGDTLRVKVTAPPVEGAANKSLIELMAAKLGLKRGRISITSGEKSRDKVVRIVGIGPEDVRIVLGG